MKQCSKERGCDGKTNLGSSEGSAIASAIRMSEKHKKAYLVYKCPHCNGHHLTAKIENKNNYANPVYIAGQKLERITE